MSTTDACIKASNGVQKRQPPRPPRFHREPDRIITAPAATVAELETCQCRWSIGFNEDGEHVFCAKVAEGGGWMLGGKPYCEEHSARAFTPPSVRRPVKRS